MWRGRMPPWMWEQWRPRNQPMALVPFDRLAHAEDGAPKRHPASWAQHRPLASIGPVCRSMCGGPHMATNLSIDPELIERGLELSGERTKKAAVTKALQEFIARRRQRRVLELFGKLEWDAAYDYKEERNRK